jgi:ketosteroid isomerase-like protein
MTPRVLTLALCLLAAPVLTAAVSGPAPAEAATTSPVAVVDRFHASMGRGDADAVATLLTDDAVIYEQGGAEASKAEYVTGHLPGDIAYSAGMTDAIASRRSEVGATFALVMTQGRTTGTHDGKPVDRLTTETMVLKRVKGVWRIAHIHWSSRAAKP